MKMRPDKLFFKLLRLVFPHKTGVVPIETLAFIAWRNMINKKLRASLTLAGVAIGIGAIFFLLSFGIGLQRLVTNQVIGSQSIKSVQVTSANSRILKLNEAALQKLTDLANVVRAGTAYSYACSLSVRGSEVDSIVNGTDKTYMDLSSLVVSRGRMFTPEDNKVVVMNQVALESVGLPNDASTIGKTVTIRVPLAGTSTRSTEIVGDFKIIGIVNNDSGNEIFVPKQIFHAAGVDVYSDMRLEATNNAAVPELRREVEGLGFQTASPLDTIDQINAIFKFFNIILAGFGGIGMIVAVLGMFNTLTISLLERTREIGLMVALGGRSTDMRKLFIMEATLLSLVGAATGILLAFFGGLVVDFIMNAFAHHRGLTHSFSLFATPPLLVLGTLSFMVLVGLAVAYFPARRAERIDPIDALRRE